MIPITKVEIGERERQLVAEVLQSGGLAQGKYVAEFEKMFGHMIMSKYTVATSNGTTALFLAMKTLGIGEGDEVITTPFTFAATVNSILETGATVRLVDIEEDSFLINCNELGSMSQSHIRAIVPVHMFGQPADMDLICSFAERHDLRIIEDAAQAHFATFQGRAVGTFDVGCFSFYATKNVTCGEGGMVSTNRGDEFEWLRILRNQGMRDRYDYAVPGYNFRMTELQAAIGLGQLERAEAMIVGRRLNARLLSSLLADIDEITVPFVKSNREHAWHQFTIKLDIDVLDRAHFVEILNARGIGTGIYYPRSITEYEAYSGHPRVLCDDDSIARRVARQVVSLPIGPYLEARDLEEIAIACKIAVMESRK